MITKEMVNAAYAKGKELRMTGLPRDFEAVLFASMTPTSPPATKGVTEAMVEALAEFLCQEFDFDLDPVVGASWPEHANDTGYRGDRAYVRLQPSDVQVRARENASRILTFIDQLAALSPLPAPEAVAWAWYYEQAGIRGYRGVELVEPDWEQERARPPMTKRVFTPLVPALSTPAAPELAVKVKPLEWWVFCSNSGNSEAETVLGNYVIQHEDGLWMLYLPHEDASHGKGYDKIDEAKAAAQADYTSRILSALSSTPVGEMVLVPKAALDWLDGSGPDAEGRWFEEFPEGVELPTERYWWRTPFRKMLAAGRLALSSVREP